MVKNLFKTLILLTFVSIQANAFEDCILMSEFPLVDIRIENNKIIDVCPLVTVMNEKNILVIHPLMVGTTCFTVWKDYKEKLLFTVRVTEEETFVSENDGVKVLTLDAPPEMDYPMLDLPPGLRDPSEIGGGK